MYFIVELEEGVYIAPWGGDPGRTLIKRSARIFYTEGMANRHLAKARIYRPFENARILKVHKRFPDVHNVHPWY